MLTDEQREDVVNVMPIVNHILKKRGLSREEDLQASAYLYLCICRERFDSKRGVKWITYAFRSISLYLMRITKREFKWRNVHTLTDDLVRDYDEEVDPNLDIAYERQWVASSSVREAYCDCTDDEKIILTLKKNGYTLCEISNLLEIRQPVVERHWRKVSKKIKSLI